jgi:nicotinate-nucleotide--dimethylbenzimidazole phosphoribosyltransferase
VTRAILEGLQQNVAGASVLAQGLGLNLSVVDVGVIGDAYSGKFVNSATNKLSKGTRNFCVEPAMTIEEVDRCLNMGREAITEAENKISCQVVALGEVGIGNTTTASTLIAALTGKPVAELCGGGAFASHTADDDKIKRKTEIVKKALQKHKGSLTESISILANVGGAEIAALVGAMLEASDRKIAVLVDGFIVTAAALVAVRMKPSVCNALFFTTKSAEKGQVAAIEEIQAIAKEHNLPVPASPALSMGLRMGECTGALLAVPILQSSANMINNMATIQDILS